MLVPDVSKILVESYSNKIIYRSRDCQRIIQCVESSTGCLFYSFIHVLFGSYFLVFFLKQVLLCLIIYLTLMNFTILKDYTF